MPPVCVQDSRDDLKSSLGSQMAGALGSPVPRPALPAGHFKLIRELFLPPDFCFISNNRPKQFGLGEAEKGRPSPGKPDSADG